MVNYSSANKCSGIGGKKTFACAFVDLGLLEVSF